ncbi:NAD(P)/FAD-dependent oxidoreductase [Patescibacteria group bacterium]|nr:MAG: NAD(P)/FAD-dependent oxidoreductase [Patescibacteria group bacterium]
MVRQRVGVLDAAHRHGGIRGQAVKGAHRIVIVGGGFAGVRTALELVKRRARLKAFEVVLVDRETSHVYNPLLYEVCTGGLGDGGASARELRAGVAVPFSDFERRVKKSALRFVRGDLSGIDEEAREILLRDGRRLGYDDFVIALGAVPNTFSTPGVAEHAYFLKWLPDAIRIRERIATFLEAQRKGKEKRVCVLVAGGGPTGVEFAAELANFLHRLTYAGKLPRDAWHVRIVEAGPSVLPNHPEKVRARAGARLDRLGVEIMTGTKVVSVESGRACLAIEGDGEECVREADVVVWAGGIRPPESVKALRLPTDAKGWIAVTPTFAVKGKEHVWALGDATSFLHPKTGGRVPALAQAATREAAIVAENVTRGLERRLPLTWIPPEHWMTVTPLGGRYAIADLGRVVLSDGLGYLARKVADFLYFSSILPLRRAIHVWVRGTRAYSKND